VDKYCDQILNGKIPACGYVKKAVENYRRDLGRIGDEDFPYVFLPERGEHVIKFFEKGIIQYRDTFAGKPFILAAWQRFALHQIYSWRHKDKGHRRFRYAYIEIPRKNGKSSWAAGIGLYELIFDKNAPEIYCCATGRKQARIVLDEARKLGRKSKNIKQPLHIREHDIRTLYNGKMEALASNSDKLDGLNPSLTILDELHAHKSFGMFHIMDTGQGARVNRLMLCISTAGVSMAHPAYAYRKYLIDILEGRIKSDDHFTLIFTTDPEDDWKTPEAYMKANPSLNVSIHEDYLKSMLEKARNNPSFEIEYRSKHLNHWVDAEKSWISDTEWMECSGPVLSDEDLKNVPCWGGLDIGRTKDLTACILLFRLGENKYHVKSTFWIPEAKVRIKEDLVDYWVWKQQGLIKVIPGNAISTEELSQDIYQMLSKYKVQTVAYDQWYSGDFVERLMKLGFPRNQLDQYSQSFKNMNAPIRKLEEMVSFKQLNHEGNEVLRWMASNVTEAVDGGGNIRFSKEKSIDKIDGMVALSMAIGTMMSGPPSGAYEKRGLRLV